MFKSIEDIKRVGEKFEKGKIVPQRVIYIKGKGKKKARHCLVFSVDLYRVSTYNNGHLFFADVLGENNGTNYLMELKGSHSNLELCGSEYGKNFNHFAGNAEGDDRCLQYINEIVFGGRDG